LIVHRFGQMHSDPGLVFLLLEILQVINGHGDPLPI
jgi:hypothetical protein